jgi:predicted MFS family arabinose efflux permease
MVFIGCNAAFVSQYRFAAAESVDVEQAGKAVSFVLAGGVAAGFLGPELGKRTRDLLGFSPYTGSFLCLAALYALAAAVLLFFRDPGEPSVAKEGEARPLKAILRQPAYIVAVAAGVVAYGVMSFTMTATPVSMHVLDHFSLSATGSVIQSHVMAMYVPSFFTGFLLQAIGIRAVMLAGALSMASCASLSVLGGGFINYLTALALLGMGWNFLFIGGTALLARSYRPAERFKAQAFNELAVFGVQAAASLLAGTVIFSLGWRTLNILALPFLVSMIAAVIATRRS